MIRMAFEVTLMHIIVHIMSHGLVVTPNACHVRACNLVRRPDVQISKKQNVSFLPAIV